MRAEVIAHPNIITRRAVKVHAAADVQSEVLGVLEENLRCPIVGRLKDRSENTWYEVNAGDHSGYVGGVDSEIDNGIPVLTYHHTLKDEENKHFLHTSTTTSDIAFSEQMTYLKQAGYETISFYQLEAYLNNHVGLNLPGKAVVLSFDDGLKSVYRYAYPVLKSCGFRATAFIISSRIELHPQKWNPDSLQFMSISELNQIQDVFDIQSHTHLLHRIDDKQKPVLLSCSYGDMALDFERSRRALLQFNPRVIYLSYPFGCYSQQAIKAARDSGFHLAVTTAQGKVNPGDNHYMLRRLYSLRTDPISAMEERIANQPGSVVTR